MRTCTPRPCPAAPGSPASSPPARRRRPTPASGLRRLAASVVAAVAGLAPLTVVLATAPAPPAGAATSPTVITTRTNPTWGKILVTGNGTTVYRLTTDPHGRSVCHGACATAWPPVLLAHGQHAPVGHGVTGLGSISRPGGQRQVTVDGVPLYRYIGDHHPGQITGNVKDTWGRWWVVNPAHPLVAPVAHHSSGTSGHTTPTTAGSAAAY